MSSRLYPQVKAARAADISLQQLGQWFADDLPILAEARDLDRTADSPSRRFSPHTILQLAVARELVRRCKASPRNALVVGMVLVGFDRGFGPISRPCGDLWPDGETLLIYAAPGDFTFIRAESLGAGVTWAEVIVDIAPEAEPAGVTVLSMNVIRDRVAKVLNLSPATLLAETNDTAAEVAAPTPEDASVPEFINLHCRRDPRHRVKPGDLYMAYRTWGVMREQPVERLHTFGRTVRGLGIGKVKSGREFYEGLTWADTPAVASLLQAAGVKPSGEGHA